MAVQSLKHRQRKGKRIVAAGWFDDGTIRYVIYEPDGPAPRAPDPASEQAKPTSRRGALAAEQQDLFG